MSSLQFVALLLALLGPLLALAGLLRVPASLLLFATGLATAFLPGLPPLQADPELLTTLFLPPILYASTARVTWHLLRHTLLPGLLAGTAVALATMLAVAALAHWLLPDLGWPAALLLGVVAALFDTVTGADSQAGRLRLWGWCDSPCSCHRLTAHRWKPCRLLSCGSSSAHWWRRLPISGLPMRR